jgi:hypothetical protein
LITWLFAPLKSSLLTMQQLRVDDVIYHSSAESWRPNFFGFAAAAAGGETAAGVGAAAAAAAATTGAVVCPAAGAAFF